MRPEEFFYESHIIGRKVINHALESGNGKISAIDPSSLTVTIKNSTCEQVFRIAKASKVDWFGGGHCLANPEGILITVVKNGTGNHSKKG